MELTHLEHDEWCQWGSTLGKTGYKRLRWHMLIRDDCCVPLINGLRVMYRFLASLSQVLCHLFWPGIWPIKTACHQSSTGMHHSPLVRATCFEELAYANCVTLQYLIRPKRLCSLRGLKLLTISHLWNFFKLCRQCFLCNECPMY